MCLYVYKCYTVIKITSININFVAYKNHWRLESLPLRVVMALTIQIRIKATRIDWKGSVITQRRLRLSPLAAEYSR